MDSLITAAARALTLGDPLGALNRIALRDDAPALALRGIAMAQLGEFDRAKSLLKRARRKFGAKEAVARARCVVAEAEIALASRDLGWPTRSLQTACAELEAHGDRSNAVHAEQLALRRLLLIGRLKDARRMLQSVATSTLTPNLRATHELIAFGIAIRSLHIKEARAALERAKQAARNAGIPALIAETENAARILEEPAAQLVSRSGTRTLSLDEIETLYASNSLVVDGYRAVVRDAHTQVSFPRRPVLFALARALAEAWPQEASRLDLIARVFRTKRPNESHRARLRVEIGRLRAALKSIAELAATKNGFVLVPKTTTEIAVLSSSVEDANGTVLALLADGESWSSSGIALALGASQRSAQRALDELASTGKVQALGRGRARRWITAPMPGFATTLLLPTLLPTD